MGLSWASLLILSASNGLTQARSPRPFGDFDVKPEDKVAKVAVTEDQQLDSIKNLMKMATEEVRRVQGETQNRPVFSVFLVQNLFSKMMPKTS